MIDLHCHLLPGVDDGAASLEEALSLVRAAVEDGTKHLVLTPHVQPGRYENTRASLVSHFEAFSAAVADAGVPVGLSIAGEVRLGAEVLQLAASDNLPFVGKWQGQNVMLLELPHSHIPPGSDKLVKWLLDRDVLPMIAHPERNKSVMDDLSKLHPFVEMGCLFQLTAMSVTADFGDSAHQRAHQILENNWATVIASDGHNLKHRPPFLSKAFRLVEKLYGRVEAQTLFTLNPATIVDGV